MLYIFLQVKSTAGMHHIKCLLSAIRPLAETAMTVISIVSPGKLIYIYIYQQTPRHPKPSLTSETSHWTSSNISWCWSTVFSEVHSQRSHLPGHFRALHASFCWQALWRCWFHFPAGLGTCPHCQRYQKLVQWPWCYCAWLSSKLAWPEPNRESMGYCQEEDETPDPIMQMTWRPLSKQPGLLLYLSSVTGWLPPCHAALMQ